MHVAYLQCAIEGVPLGCPFEWCKSCNAHMHTVSPQREFNSQMFRQVALLSAAKIAMLTCKWFLPSANSQVRGQVALCSGAVAAMLTCIWLLPSVHSHVYR